MMKKAAAQPSFLTYGRWSILDGAGLDLQAEAGGCIISQRLISGRETGCQTGV